MSKRPYAVTFAATVVAALILGLPGAASAAPGGRGPQAGAHGQAAQGDRRLAVEQRKVATQVRVKDAALARAVRTVTRASLAVGEAEVLSNIAADRIVLADLNAAAAGATTVTDVRAVGAQVKAVRPEAYTLVVNGLRRAAHYEGLTMTNADTVAELSALADLAELDGFDVTDIRAGLDLAAVTNDEVLPFVWSAREAALTVTATSPREEQRAVFTDLATAGELLDSVAEQLVLASDALAALGYPTEPADDEADDAEEPAA